MRTPNRWIEGKAVSTTGPSAPETDHHDFPELAMPNETRIIHTIIVKNACPSEYNKDAIEKLPGEQSGQSRFQSPAG
jgi:hypothetical protein